MSLVSVFYCHVAYCLGKWDFHGVYLYYIKNPF